MVTHLRKSCKINFQKFWEIKRFAKSFYEGATLNDIVGEWNREDDIQLSKVDVHQVKKCKTYQEYRELVRNGGVVNKLEKNYKKTLAKEKNNSHRDYLESEAIRERLNVLEKIDKAVQGLTSEEKLNRALSNLGDAIIELTNRQK